MMDKCKNCKRPVMKNKAFVCKRCGVALCMQCSHKEVCADCFTILNEKALVVDYFTEKYNEATKCT